MKGVFACCAFAEFQNFENDHQFIHFQFHLNFIGKDEAFHGLL